MTVNASPNPFKVPTHPPSTTPGKRPARSSIESSPCPWTSDIPSRASQVNSDLWPGPSTSTCSTPFTPYPSQPSDSPTNPFGRKRTERLIHTLPTVTSFAKHVPLRLQVIRTGKPALSPKMGGVHRVVQVPMNYTFSHLRCMIHWLFEPSLGKLALTTSQAWKRHNIPPTAVDARGHVIPWQDEDYLFEIKTGVVMFSPLYKPGEIRTGKTEVKISNVRDPGSWKARFGIDQEEESEDEDELADESQESGVTEEEGEWRWEDEQDYTLSHVWPTGLSMETAIIYHHDHRTQVHITVNNSVLPKRRGHGNTPFVFTARGRLSLSPRKTSLPRPSFSSSVVGSSPPRPGKAGWFSSPLKSTGKKRAYRRSISPSGSPSPKKRMRRDKVLESAEEAAPVILAPDSDAEGSSDDEFPLATQEVEEDPSAVLDIESWNNPPHAFGIYLVSRLGLPPSLRLRPSGSNMSLHESSRLSEDVFSTHTADDDVAGDAEEVDEEEILDGSFFVEKETYDPFAFDDPADDEDMKNKRRKGTPLFASKRAKSSPLPPSSPPKTSPVHTQFRDIEDEGYEEEDAEGEEDEGEDVEIDLEEQDDEADAREEEEEMYEEDYENDAGNVSSASLPCLVADDHDESFSEPASTSSRSRIFPASRQLSPRSLSSFHAHVTKHHIGYDPSKLPSETPLPHAAFIMSNPTTTTTVEGVKSTTPIPPLLSASTLNSKSRENLRAAARAQLLKMDRVEKRIDGMKKNGYMKEVDAEIEAYADKVKGKSKGSWRKRMAEERERLEREAAEAAAAAADEEVDELDEDRPEEEEWDPFGNEPEI